MFALIASGIGQIIDTGLLAVLIVSVVLGVAFLATIIIMIIKQVKYRKQIKHNEKEWAEFHIKTGIKKGQ